MVIWRSAAPEKVEAFEKKNGNVEEDTPSEDDQLLTLKTQVQKNNKSLLEVGGKQIDISA